MRLTYPRMLALTVATLAIVSPGCGGKTGSPSAGSTPTPAPVAATPAPVPTPSLPGATSCARFAKGYCSRFDGEEIVVKTQNGFSEHYDVFLGEGFVRRGLGIYRSTCWPAAF